MEGDRKSEGKGGGGLGQRQPPAIIQHEQKRSVKTTPALENTSPPDNAKPSNQVIEPGQKSGKNSLQPAGTTMLIFLTEHCLQKTEAT